jgi:long-subunit acyl-CoA synthetase (AMP-forming)
VGETVVDLFVDRVRELGQRPALRHYVEGAWHSITWSEYGSSVREAAAGLIAQGIQPGDRVGILAGNQPRWHIADLGILSAGAVSVPSYPTGTASQVAHVLGHSRCRVCFVGDRDQLAKMLLVHRRLPELERIVLLGQPPDGLDDDLLVTFDDLCALGRDHLEEHPQAVDETSRAIRPTSLATTLVALDVEAVNAHLGGGGGDADPTDLTDVEVLASHPVVHQEIDRSIQQVNAGRAPIEQIKAWRIIPGALTLVGGELTPTFKVRRAAVAARFGELIDEMYAGARTAPPR